MSVGPHKLVAPTPEAVQTALVVHLAEEFTLAYSNADFDEADELRELDRGASELRDAIAKLRKLQIPLPAPEPESPTL
jgi:hypothetical protein